MILYRKLVSTLDSSGLLPPHQIDSLSNFAKNNRE